MTITFKRLQPGAILPQYAHPGDAGMDLCACEACEIAPGARLLVRTGLVMELPAGTEAQVRPRSGLALKHGVTLLNTPGTIDAGYRGEIGIIAPVSEPLCGRCNRIRLTADGHIRTCLFSVNEHDLRSRLRGGASDEGIAEWLKSVVWQKEARHHIGEPEFVSPPRSMSCSGG